jgi:hypothetical protein
MKVAVRCAAVAAACVAAALTAGAASAGPGAVSPYDGGGVATTPAVSPALVTGLFGLTVDLGSFGVGEAELATAGPTAASSSANGATLTVDDNLLDCPTAQFTSIQAAVTAAPAGAMIKVCRGTYIEQVVITKNGLTLYSVPDLAARIQAPPAMSPGNKSIVTVTGAQDVTIRHFTIAGPGGGPCDSLEYGVRVDGGGSALITDNHITDIRDSPFGGCQNGVGVLVGRNSQSTYGTATVVHNLIDNYQKGGVVVDGQLAPGSTPSNAEVAFNEIAGIGPTPVIAQNGIQVSRGAIANVHHNVVHDNVYSLSPFFGEGILLFETATSQATIHHNKVYENADGIGLYDTQNIEVGWNYSHHNLFYEGLYADPDTRENVIEHNKLVYNADVDCYDDTAGPYAGASWNHWLQDLGYTENKPGLCKHATP